MLAEEKVPWEQNLQQPAQKKNLRSGKNITDKTTVENIYGQLDMKLGQFMEEETDAVLKKWKTGKLQAPNKIPPKVWKTRKFDDIFDYAMLCTNKTQWMNGKKAGILPFSEKDDQRIAKNYRSITLNVIAAKFYHPRLLNPM